jgi:hypothetical protein
MSVNGQLLGNPSLWSNIKYRIGDDVTLPIPKYGARLVRKKVRRDVDTTMPVIPGNPLIRWKIPSNSNVIYDFRRAKCYIRITVTAVGGGWIPAPSALAWNIIERFRLEQGGQYVEDRRFFNLQETLVYEIQTHQNQQQTTGVGLYGDGSLALRQTQAVDWVYCLPIPSTGLTKAVYPWYQSSKGTSNNIVTSISLPDTYLQWELARPEAFVEVSGGAGAVTVSWSVSRFEIEYEELYLENGNAPLIAKWLMSENAISKGYPNIWYRTFLTNNYPLSVATEQTSFIDIRLSSIISLFVTFRFAATVNDPTILNKHSTYLGPTTTNLIEYQWEMNSSLWPDKPVGVIAPNYTEAYAMFLESWQMYHSRGIQQEVTPITKNQFINDKFVLAFDGNAQPFATLMINPLSTSLTNSQIQLKMKFNPAPPAGLEIVVHAYHWRRWYFGAKGGGVSVVET